MRFTCDHCGKRYVTNDVLQPGRVYRTRCKACGGMVTVRGDPASGSATGEVPAPTPRPPSPTPAAVPLPTPSPVALPHSRSRPAVATAQAPRAEEPRYVEIFDDDGPETAPLAAQAAPRAPQVTTPRTGAPTRPAARPPAPATLSAGPDPFAVAMEVAPTPRPSALAVVRPAPLAVAPVEPPPPAPRRLPLVAIGLMSAAAAVLVGLLAVGAVWRPWMPRAAPAVAHPPRGPAVETPVDAGADPTPPAAALPTPTPAPPAAPALAEPPPPPEPSRHAREQEEAAASAAGAPRRTEPEPLTQAEKAPGAREEKAARAAERAEKERPAREEKARPRAERERLAREERERLKAERAEKERLAREERARARQEAKVASAEPPPPAPGLSPDAVQTALASARKRFEACFRDQARGLVAPIAASRATVRFLVQPGGTVTAPEIAEPDVASLPAGECLKSTAATLEFPTFRGEPTRVEAPVTIPPGPPGGRFLAVEFTGPHAARGGGLVDETIYSERSNDAAITDRAFADGVITYSGQVGMGEGSKYAGIGVSVNMLPGPKPVDASRFRSMTIRLAATGTRSLRIRIIGAEDTTRYNGCYPVVLQRVTPDVTAYVLAFSDFDPELWCGSKGRSWKKTLPELVGFEIADANMDRRPVSFSVGSITLNP